MIFIEFSTLQIYHLSFTLRPVLRSADCASHPHSVVSETEFDGLLMAYQMS